MGKIFSDLLNFLGSFFWLIVLIYILTTFRKNLDKIRTKYKNGKTLKKLVPPYFDIEKFANIKNLIIRRAEKIQFPAQKLDRHKKYLQIALNSTFEEAEKIISQLPNSDRILIEAGTPLIKNYGIEAISEIKNYIFLNSLNQNPYIVADLKCADMGKREVNLAAQAGASAATCLGVAPIETIDEFINECQKCGIDSMIDMMNVENPLSVLKRLKAFPDVVIIHRGVDETETNKEKLIPYYQINQIKGNCDVFIAIAGGDTMKEIQSAVFNGADIVILWKAFYQSEGDIGSLVGEFLTEIR